MQMDELTPDTFEALDFAELISKTPCVVIKFYASWCGPCKSKEFRENYEKLKNKYSDEDKTIKFLELDIEEFEELINSKEYYNIDVKSIPYFKISYNGVWIKEFTGTSNIPDIDNILAKVVERQKNGYNDKIESV